MEKTGKGVFIMMLEPAMKDLLKQVPSRYELAGEPLEEKPVSIAIQAVARGELDKKPVETEEA